MRQRLLAEKVFDDVRNLRAVATEDNEDAHERAARNQAGSEGKSKFPGFFSGCFFKNPAQQSANEKVKSVKPVESP